MNLPHPMGLMRELRENAQQYENSAYARTFQAGAPSDPKIFFGNPMTPQTLSGWVKDETARARYVTAFEQSDFDGLLSYYKANYPRTDPDDTSPLPEMPKVQAPVLMFHGLDDFALLPGGLNDTWKWLEKDLTLVTVPGSGHFVQQDASELVTKTMKWWLAR